jgi:hypothetical protein
MSLFLSISNGRKSVSVPQDLKEGEEARSIVKEKKTNIARDPIVFVGTLAFLPTESGARREGEW